MKNKLKTKIKAITAWKEKSTGKNLTANLHRLTRFYHTSCVLSDNIFFGIVPAPAKDLKLTQSKPDMEKVNITCLAQGVYPEPKMALYKDPDRNSK